MSTYRYASLYEDVAHHTFIKHVLPQLAQGFNFVVEEIDNFRVKAQNRSEVDKFCKSASKEAFVNYRADFFIVCRDIDSFDTRVYEQRNNNLTAEIHYTGSHRTILCLPVQCIEHWLLYLKQHSSDTTRTQNKPLETIPRNHAKIEVYGRLKPSKDVCITAVTEHCTAIDIDWLISRSESFRKFATNVQTVLQQLAPQNPS